MASQCGFETLIKYSCLKDLLFFSSFAFCFSCPCPEWRDRRRGKEGEKWKGHEWWMLCVCLSFPITELCLLKRRSDAFLISAFLTDEEQTLTGGHCVFKKTASLVIQYLLQIQYTAAAAPALQRSSNTTFSSFVFILLFRFQMYSFPVLRSVMARCKEKFDYIFCF